MYKWSNETEEQITQLIKDWLKNHGKSQSDLCQILNSPSTRMSSLIEILRKDFSAGGMASVASRLCEVEISWSRKNNLISSDIQNDDPFGQLDLLLEEINEDYDG